MFLFLKLITGTYYVISLGFRIEIKPASLVVYEQLYLVFLHSGCTQIVVRERAEIDEARGGRGSAHPTTPKFIDLFSLSPIFIRPEINREQTQVWGRTIQYGVKQCSVVQYSTIQYSVMKCSVVQYSRIQYSTDKNVFTGKKGLVR